MEQFFWSLLSDIYRWRVSGEKVTLKIKSETVGTITRAGELSFDFQSDETGESVEIFYNEIIDCEDNIISLYVPSYS